MAEVKFTPGPWRWEINATHKSVHLVGGVPAYDLTVMDFDRWGMSGAVVRLREDVDGMNIMHKVSDRPEWVSPFPGREHHAHWCANVNHPDAHLIAASPALYEALRNLVVMLPSDCPEIEGSERVPKGLVYIRWQDLREARAALALAEGKKE